jgi:hypothetical protein
MLVPVILQNAAYIGAAFTIFTSLGCLWFRPGGLVGLPNDAHPLARVALYPVLGFMLVMIGASWLRILDLPFSKSAPWLLAFLVVVPLGFWLWRLRNTDARPNPVRFLTDRGRRLWVLFVPFLLGVILVNRLTVPELYDVGRWGYDQVNYVHIADQYMEHGAFGSEQNGGAVLKPWLAATAASVWNLCSGKFSFFIGELSTNLQLSTTKGQLGLLVRNGGAAVDACFGVWLGLDGIQAYVLSLRMQYLLLACCGLWIALQMRLAGPWLLLIPAIASLWPCVILPSLVDNRDQTYGFILIFVILVSSVCGGLNSRICGLALAALTFAYLEIVPIAIILWTAFRIDDAPFRAGAKSLFAEGLIGLLVTLPFLPFNISFLLAQLGSGTTLHLGMPLGNLLGPLSPISGAFAGIWSGPLQVLVILSISGSAFLAFQLLGLVHWLSMRRFFSVFAFLALATLASSLYYHNYQYVTYKFLTALFPVAVLLCATALGPLPVYGASSPLFNYKGLRSAPKTATFLATLCVPALAVGAAMRSGFVFDGLTIPAGSLDILEDRSALTPQNGLRVRSNDVLNAKMRAQEAGKNKGVALSNFTRGDLSYVAHFLRSRKAVLVNGLFFNERTGPFSDDFALLGSGQKIHWLFLLNSETAGAMRYDGLENVMWLSGKPKQVMVFRSFTCLSLSPKSPFVFAQRLYSQYLQDVSPATRLPQTRFLFGSKGIAFGVYALNTDAIPYLLQFEIASSRENDLPRMSAELESWAVFANFNETRQVDFEYVGDRVCVQIPLALNPAGHVIELGPRDRLPMGTPVFSEPAEPASDEGALYELRNVRLIPRPL